MATRKPSPSEAINPRETMARRMSDAEDDDDVVPEPQPKKVDPPTTMSQAQFSGYDKKRGPATPPPAMLKRRARD